jgi:hypothetical protein
MNRSTQLSEAEVTAGISRKALDALQRKNGSNGKHIHDARDARDVRHVPEGFRDPSESVVPGQPPLKSIVISSWCRELAVINHDGWGFQIRDTVHYSGRADVITLSLNRNDLESLQRGIAKVLEESPRNGARP